MRMSRRQKKAEEGEGKSKASWKKSSFSALSPIRRDPLPNNQLESGTMKLPHTPRFSAPLIWQSLPKENCAKMCFTREPCVFSYYGTPSLTLSSTRPCRALILQKTSSRLLWEALLELLVVQETLTAVPASRSSRSLGSEVLASSVNHYQYRLSHQPQRLEIFVIHQILITIHDLAQPTRPAAKVSFLQPV